MRTLTTPIAMPNVNRIDPIRVRDNRDDGTPSMTLVVQLVGVGGRNGGIFALVARDTGSSDSLTLNAAPTSYTDIVIRHEGTPINNACSALGTAYDNAPGNRAAKRDAVLDAAYAIGMIAATLAAT
jgi:hypothetical protein